MITLANIRRAVYYLNKRVDLLNTLLLKSDKSEIPAAQILSDWNLLDDTKLDYIKNKPATTNGEDGKSAYELAVDNGYSGTIQQWLDSLKGQDGTNGTNGTNGITPHIDQTTGNWFIGETNTGVKASFSSESAESGGTTLSVVTTGEKHNWNNKANVWRGTQAEYDLISTPDNNTIYIITPDLP